MNHDSAKIIMFVLFTLSSLFFSFQILSPIFLPHDSVTDLSGYVGIIDNERLTKNMPFPWNVIYIIGDVMCHQRSDRSFFINGNQMPFCARCTGIWLGFAVGFGIYLAFNFRIKEKHLWIMLVFIAPLFVDGIGQLLGFWESTNLIRIVTGFLAGSISSIFLSFMITELYRSKKPS